MRASIYDFRSREYTDGEIPDGSSAYEADMDKVVPCASCGLRHTFGNMYTSRRIHTGMGFGYAVCLECYEREWADEKEAENG